MGDFDKEKKDAKRLYGEIIEAKKDNIRQEAQKELEEIDEKYKRGEVTMDDAIRCVVLEQLLK